MDNKKMIYEIYINNKQFTCLTEKIENEKKIRSIIGFQDLIFLERKNNNDSIKLFYKLNELFNIKIYLNDKFILEKEFPLSIQLNRMRDLLAQKINSNCNFSVDYNIIQIKEESFFNLKKIVKINQINLYDKEFIFDEENIEEGDKIYSGSEKIKEIEASKK